MTLTGGVIFLSKVDLAWGGPYILQSPDKSLWQLSINDDGTMPMPVKVASGDISVISLLDLSSPTRTIYALTIDNNGILWLTGGSIPNPLPVYKCLVCGEIFVRDPRFPHPCEDYENPTSRQDDTWKSSV